MAAEDGDEGVEPLVVSLDVLELLADPLLACQLPQPQGFVVCRVF
jgi:hypothetical protein